MANAQKSRRTAEGKIASVEDLLAAAQKPSVVEELEIPEWDGLTVKVQGFSHKKAVDLGEEITDEDGEADTDRANTLTLVYGVLEPQLDEEKAAKLRDGSAAAIGRILNKINELNGETQDQRKDTDKSFRSGARGE
jgi:hypothetical protein